MGSDTARNRLPEADVAAAQSSWAGPSCRTSSTAVGGKPTAMTLTVSGELAFRSDFCDNAQRLADAYGAAGDGSGGKGSVSSTGMGVSADFTVAGTLRQGAMSRRC